MKSIVCSILIFVAIGQEVDILDLNYDFSKEEESQEFYYIAEEFSLPAEKWVARIKGVCSTTAESNLERLFARFYKMNRKMGANSFVVDSSMIAADTITVFLSLYHLSEEELGVNWELYPCNRIYVFGDLILSKSPKSRQIKINQESIKIEPL